MKQYLFFLLFPVILFSQFDRSGLIGNNNGKFYIISDNLLNVYNYDKALIRKYPIDSVPLILDFSKII